MSDATPTMPAHSRLVAVAKPAAAAAVAAVGTAGIAALAHGFLTQQAALARRVIPRPMESAPNSDGVYAPGADPVRLRRGVGYDAHLMVFGDSTAAGLGADVPAETPGARLARLAADESGLTLRLSTKAIVGATSKGLAGQVDAMLIAGRPPDVAVILVGANDIAAVNAPGPSATRLGDAVRRLKNAGAEVVVGTCPDLGVITAIPQPLRSIMRAWGRRLAAAQNAAVRRAGGVAVPMADLLTKEFLQAPDRMLSADRYHPSSAGYELAAHALLPATLNALGAWGTGPLPEPPQRSAIADSASILRRMAGRWAS